MRPNITITIPTPYLPIDEYCRITGAPMGTARDMVRDGRLPIRGKGISLVLVLKSTCCAYGASIKRMQYFA